MPEFLYTARDPATGKKVQGTVIADSEGSVGKLIKDQGLAVLEVKVKSDSDFLGFITNRVGAKDKVVFSRQLATLINAGLPLAQSLRSVTKQTKNKALQSVLTKVITDIEGGKAFSVALEAYPQIFDRVFVSLVAAGETSGTLDAALERIANQQEKDAELASKVRGAMVYPIIVMLVMIGVVTFMLVSVLPQVKELYDGLPGTQLPFITRMLLAASDFIIGYWWVLIAIIGAMIFGATKWARTGPGKDVIDRGKLVLWPVSQLFRKMYMARFARTATTLVASGVPLIQVLEIVKRAINNVHIESEIARATEKVKGGRSLAESLQGSQNFDELVPNMIKIGEDSGALETMLDKTADYFEKEVDNQVKAISTIIEPVLMIVLGVVAITIVAAILIPIYGLVGQNVI